MSHHDMEALAQLWLEAYPGTITSGNELDDVIADWRAAFAGQYGTLAGEASLVVERAGRIVAALQTVVDAPWEHTPSGPFIIELFVAPVFRRQGLAAGLLGTALDALTRNGHRTAGLRVDADNPAALALYRRAGFTEWAEDEAEL